MTLMKRSIIICLFAAAVAQVTIGCTSRTQSPPPSNPPTPYVPLPWIWENPLPQGNTIHGLWGSSGSDVYAVSENGAILHFNGSGWALVQSNTNTALYDVWGCSDDEVFSIGYVNTGLPSGENKPLRYDGSNWSSMTNLAAGLTPGNYKALWGTSSQDLWAAGDQGTIIHFDGTAWTQMTASPRNDLLGIWCALNGTDRYAVGMDGTILHSQGAGWSAQASSTNQHLFGAWGASASDVFVVGTNGTILRGGTGGWSQMTSNTAAHLNAIHGTSSTDVFAVGSGGEIVHPMLFIK